jgi:hypothetical protein
MQISAPKPVARGSTTQVIIDAEPPRPYMIGESYSAGILRHRVGYGATLKKVPNPFLWEVKVFSAVGPVEALVEEQFDFGAVGGYYSGFYSSTSQLGQRPESGALTPPFGAAPAWSSSHKLSGCAAIGGNYKFDKDGKVFASGTPLHGAIWRGEKVYDPRLDSTYPGGSGSCRLGVESTYVYSASPPLHAGTYAYGRYENGIRIFGLGLSGDAIDWAAIVDWANDCDTVDWTAHGTIYEGGRGADIRQQRVQNLDDICAAGGGRWLQAGALLSFDWHRPRVPLATLTDDDLLEEGGNATAVQTIRERMNGIRPQYVSPAHNWEQITADEIIGSTYRTEDGQPLTQTWALNLVKQPEQAGELACYALVDSREIGPIELKCKAAWRFYKPGETITINSSLLGYQGQAVIIARDLDPQTLAVKLVVKSETPAKHDFALGKVANPPPSPILTQTQEDRDLVKAGAITPRAVDVEYDDGQPVQDLQPAEPGATEGAVIPVPGSGQPGNVKDGAGNLRDPGELLNSELAFTQGGRLGYESQAGRVEITRLTPRLLGAVETASLKQVEADLDTLQRAVTLALSETSKAQATFRDAGVYTDPATGIVRIHALEQTRERVSTAEIRLSAAESNINLRATNSFVIEQIALAAFDPSQIADLTDIFLRLGAAEVDIDGLNASVTSLATVTELSLVEGRVTTAEEAIDALEGTITTKVDTTTFDLLATRVTSAETTLTAIGDVASITNAVSATRLVQRQLDSNTDADIRALLLGDRAKREEVAAIAAARNELGARITEQGEAQASFSLSLQARVGAAESSIAAESLTRSGQFGSLAQSITNLAASLDTEVGTLQGNIDTLQQALVDETGALATSISEVSASLDTVADNLADETQNRIDAVAGEAGARIAAIEAEAAARGEALTAEEQARIAALQAERDQTIADIAAEAAARNEAVGIVDARVTSVEQASVDRDGAINALVTRQATAVRGSQQSLDDLINQAISGLVLADRAARQASEQLAFVREEIAASITDLGSGTASQLFALGVRIGQAEGSIRELDRVVIENNTALVQSIDTLTLSTTASIGSLTTDLSVTTGRVDTVEGDVSNTIGRVDGLEEDLPAGLAAEAAARTVEISGAITAERLLWQEGDSIIAGIVDTISTTVDENTATLTTFGESIDGLKARWGVKVDVDGRVGGFVLNGTAEDIDATFVVDTFSVVDPDTGTAFLSADEDGLRLQNGKVVMDNGVNMLVMGAGFGVDNQFVMWFGPSRAINLCNEDDALFFLDVTGDGEYGLRLGSNFYKNSGTGTSIASNAQIIVGPFTTDGGAKQINVGYQYRRLVQITDAFAYTGTPQAVLRVERQVGSGGFTTVGDYTFNGTASGENGNGPAEPGSALIQINGGASFTDNTGGTGDFTYRVSIISRAVGGLTSTVSLEDSLSQQVTLISTEQIT